MGFWDFIFGKERKRSQVDEIMEMTLDDSEFDECVEAGLIPSTNPSNDDDEPDTELLKDNWWPF